MAENRKISRWIITIAASIVFIMVACVAMVIIVDPFFQYHKPISGFPYKVDNQLSNNAGMAKTFEYDSILTGSSMVSNFDLQSIEDKLCAKTIKVNYNGAYPKDIANILDYVFGRRTDLKTVYFGMDVYSYNSPTEDVKYPFPQHLYDDNLFNDVSYLFNKDVLVEYIVEPLRFPSQKTDLSRVYMMEYPESLYNEAFVLEGYENPQKEEMSEAEFDQKIAALNANLNENLLPFIEGHPETRFVVFYPPYSILYWNTRGKEGWNDLLKEEYEITAGKLLEYDNVEVYNFSDLWEYTTDLNNYVDYIHQHARVNEVILDCIAGGEHKLTKENTAKLVDEMFDFIAAYDYSQLLGENNE